MEGEPIQETVSQPETMVYRNHYSYVIQNLVSLILTLGLILLINYFSNRDEGFVLVGWSYAIIILVVGLMFVYIRMWILTTYTFGPTELYVFRNTYFKKETKIQYSKMASVNVRRTIVNRIFGSTTLLFNVNSSVNSNNAEATLVLKSDEADKLREIISSRIFNKEMEVKIEQQLDSMVRSPTSTSYSMESSVSPPYPRLLDWRHWPIPYSQWSPIPTEYCSVCSFSSSAWCFLRSGPC